MALYGEQTTFQPPLTADYLKSLSSAELSDVLLGVAQRAAQERLGFDEPATILGLAAVYPPYVAEQEAAALDFELISPSPIADKLISCVVIDETMDKIKEAQTAEPDSGWTEKDTSVALREICKAQAQSSLSYACEFVREKALYQLFNPGNRGVILLRNALNGDRESYEPGIEALQSGVQDHELDWSSACESLEVLMTIMKHEGFNDGERLQGLAIDMLLQMSQWKWSGQASTLYASRYVSLTARLASIVKYS
jgi:hypothetical protein